jgi:hypothetical protein
MIGFSSRLWASQPGSLFCRSRPLQELLQRRTAEKHPPVSRNEDRVGFYTAPLPPASRTLLRQNLPSEASAFAVRLALPDRKRRRTEALGESANMPW